MNFVSLPVYVNLAHLVFGIFFISGHVLFSTGLNLFKSEISYLLFMIFVSLCYFPFLCL